MTDRAQYIQLCQEVALPLHAQAWWWEQSSVGKTWDALVLEKDDHVLAAMPYHLTRKGPIQAMLMPMHTQYHHAYIAPSKSEDVYPRLAQGLDTLCRERHIAWCQMQGFYPAPLLEALRAQGFAVSERTTYRMDTIPTREDLPKLFSENKRRQLRKAQGLRLVELMPDTFYAFHQDCMTRQGKTIDYPLSWAQAVLSEALRRQSGQLLGAQNAEGQVVAAMFLAWDKEWAYYLLPTYDPAYKDTGAMTWLTFEALCLAREKGLGFDFEGSMTPSIASSYKQFGGQAVTYHRIEKIYNPLLRIALWLRQRL